MSDNDDPQQNWARSLGLLSVVTAELVGFTGAGVGLGYLAWNRWGAPWWVLLLSSIAGLCVAFYRLFLISKKNFQ